MWKKQTLLKYIYTFKVLYCQYTCINQQYFICLTRKDCLEASNSSLKNILTLTAHKNFNNKNLYSYSRVFCE